MGFAVFHIEKGKGNGSSIGSHIDREAGREYTYKNADPNRKDLNRNYNFPKYSKIPLHQAIKKRIEDGYTGEKAIRKDAVRYLSIVMTGTHENMEEIFADKEKKEKWLKANYKYAVQEFGKKNILRFSLHMDEKTPHIHLVVVPLTADGRLSAKERMGDRIELSAKQDRYAEQMKEFGLDRGVVGSKAVHNSEGWYLGQQKKNQEAFLADTTSFSLMERINPFKKIEKLTEAVKVAVKQKTEAELLSKRRVEQQNQQSLREDREIKKSKEYKLKLDAVSLKLDVVNLKFNGSSLAPRFEKMFVEIQEEFIVKRDYEKAEVRRKKAEKNKTLEIKPIEDQSRRTRPKR